MFAHKSISIKGNLNDQNLKYRLCPSDEFANGRWSIACLSASFELPTETTGNIDIIGNVTNVCFHDPHFEHEIKNG